jgi:hypothetical protein
MEKTIVEISKEQRMKLEMITMDNDAEAALLFAKELLSQIRQSENRKLKSHLDK